MPSAIERFFSQPTRRSYLLARQVVVARSTYQPLDFEVSELGDLNHAGRFNEVLARVASLSDQFVLSSRLFFQGAIAATELGLADMARDYRTRFCACLRGVLATGDGSRKNPYRVTYTTDERDVLEALGLRANRQRLVETSNRALDVLECDDGSEIWFDVSTMLPNRPKRRRARNSPLQGTNRVTARPRSGQAKRGMAKRGFAKQRRASTRTPL